MTDDGPRACSACPRVDETVRRRIPLVGAPALCRFCWLRACEGRAGLASSGATKEAPSRRRRRAPNTAPEDGS